MSALPSRPPGSDSSDPSDPSDSGDDDSTGTFPQRGGGSGNGPPPLLKEEVLNGRFRVGKEIGRGGMGIVFHGEQLSLERPVAIKVLLPDKRQDPEAVRRFLAEAKTVSLFRHDNVVDVIDMGETPAGLAFMVMEYLNGEPLDQVLKKRGRLPWPQVRRVALEVLAGLTAAHDKGIVHQDVKPSNCFCVRTEEGERFERIKLLDFGIARPLSAPTSSGPQTGKVMGSAPYMSPEQADSRDTDARSDLYSLGIMMYELVTGVRPFRSAHFKDAIRQHLYDTPPRMREVTPDLELPIGVEAFILRALEKQPELRFQSAREMAQALTALSGVSVSTRAQARETPLRPSGEFASVEHRNRTELHQVLDKVRRFWITDVLAGNSAHTSLAPQHRTLEDELVMGARGGARGHVSQGPTPTTKSPYEIFEACARELLIVGSAGSGKTTVLLQLAESLVDGVGSLEGEEPIPVVFSLATFNRRIQDFGAWLVEELRSKYRVPTKLAQRFLETGRILPLLDGLDECSPEAREACVVAINNFMEGDHRPPGLAVACRLDTYKSIGTPLNLNGALRLHELTDSQLVSYLDQPRSDGTSLRAFLEKNEGLSDIARTPLVLSLINTIFKDLSAESGGGSTMEPTLGGIYERYLTLARRRKRARDGDDPLKTEQALGRLAVNMGAHQHTIFLFQDLQATWLHSPVYQWLYVMLSRLMVGLIFGASLVLPLTWSPLENNDFKSTLEFGLALALVTTVVYGTDAFLVLRATQKGGTPLHRTGWRHARRGILGALVATVMGAIMYAQHIMNEPQPNMSPVTNGIMMGLFTPVIFCHWYGAPERYRDIGTVESLRWSWSAAWRALPLALAIAVLIALPSLLQEDNGSKPYMAALCNGALGFGIVLLFKAMQRVTSPLKDSINGGITLSSRSALVTGAGFASYVTLVFGSALDYNWGYGAIVGLSLWVWGALWYGGFAVVLHYTLRGVLWLDEQPEYLSTRFFDAAVDRLLLRSRGGGYMFLHQTFQQHMAERHANPPPPALPPP